MSDGNRLDEFVPSYSISTARVLSCAHDPDYRKIRLIRPLFYYAQSPGELLVMYGSLGITPTPPPTPFSALIF
jgi:hypothetical protein